MKNAHISGFAALAVVVAVGSGCGGDDQKPPQVPEAVVDAAPPPPPPPEPEDASPPPPPPKPSMQELQGQAMQAALDGLNGHDAAKFASVYADDAFIRVAGGNDLTGRDGVQANMKEWFDTFTKIKLGFSRVWTKGNVVVLEWVINGTHSGQLFGVKGTEQPIGHYGLSVVWFNDDGKVKEEHRYGELGVVLSQIGATKEAPRPIPTVPATAELIQGSDSDDMKALDAARALEGSVVSGKKADFEAVVTDDFEYDGILSINTVKGKKDAGAAFTTIHNAFPDMAIGVTSSWVFGNYAIVEYTMSGTQKGKLGTFAASKRPVNVHLVDIYKVKDGKVARAWTYQNSLELMSQIKEVNVPLVTPPKSAAPKK